MELKAETREITGKKVKALRRQGILPAELYGHGFKNEHLSLAAKEFNKVFKEAGQTTVVNVAVGTKKHPVMIHDLVRDPRTSEIIHVDLYEVHMDEKIRAHVPFEFVGEAPAVKEKSAVVNRAMSELEVEALPANMPHSIVVDLSSLDDIGKSIYVKDLALPKGVEFDVDGETVIATATEPLPEEVAAPAEPVDVSAVKVETEEKKAERDAEKAAGGEE